MQNRSFELDEVAELEVKDGIRIRPFKEFNMNCIACGSSALVTGLVFGRSGGETIVFTPDEVSNWKSMFGLGTRKVRAYGCVHCQHLQLAVEFSENDVRRYQQFEGEQPSLLDRINFEEDEARSVSPEHQYTKSLQEIDEREGGIDTEAHKMRKDERTYPLKQILREDDSE